VLQAVVHARQAVPPDIEERGQRGREDQRVPQPACRQAPSSLLVLRLLHEAADAKDGADGRLAEQLPGFDPAKFRLGTGRRSAQQHHQLRVPGHVRQDFGGMRAERLLLEDEMVRREDGDYGLRVPLPDPVRGEQHGRSGPPVFGLKQHSRARPSGQLPRDMRRMLHPAHDDGALRGHQALHAVQRLAKE
jgi:hypothetical protein